MRVVIFLQNAWSPVYAGRSWPRESWLRALALSRSGQRLAALTDDLNECENTTEKVGPSPDSLLPADEKHIRRVLRERSPAIVIACGKQAEKALKRLWKGALICVPHPACRVLTTACYLRAQSIMDVGFNGRLALRQRRGAVEMEAV